MKISYRDSRLTMLLADCLGGESVALMIACCSPARASAVESIRTLQFAMGVKRIKNKLIPMVDPHVSVPRAVAQFTMALLTPFTPIVCDRTKWFQNPCCTRTVAFLASSVDVVMSFSLYACNAFGVCATCECVWRVSLWVFVRLCYPCQEKLVADLRREIKALKVENQALRSGSAQHAGTLDFGTASAVGSGLVTLLSRQDAAGPLCELEYSSIEGSDAEEDDMGYSGDDYDDSDAENAETLANVSTGAPSSSAAGMFAAKIAPAAVSSGDATVHSTAAVAAVDQIPRPTLRSSKIAFGDEKPKRAALPLISPGMLSPEVGKSSPGREARSSVSAGAAHAASTASLLPAPALPHRNLVSSGSEPGLSALRAMPRQLSPIALMEPSPSKPPPVATQFDAFTLPAPAAFPKPPKSSMVMSPTMLEQLLKSGATLGPRAETASSKSRKPGLGSGTGAVGAGGGGSLFQLPPAVVPTASAAASDLSKDVFFDPEKRAEALRRLRAKREGHSPSAFGGDQVKERGRLAMAATRHHLY